MFANGDVAQGMEKVAELCGAAYFTWTLEWLGEAEHAATKKDCVRGPHHSASYVSFSKRWLEMDEFMKSSVDNMQCFVENFQSALSRGGGIHALGLGKHPEIVGLPLRGLRKSTVEKDLTYHAHSAQCYCRPPRVQTIGKECVVRDNLHEPCPSTSTFSRHATEVWRRLAIEHICERLASVSGACFSLHLREGCVQTLRSLLHSQASVPLAALDDHGVSAAQLPRLEDEVVTTSIPAEEKLPKRAQDMIFFKFVRASVQDMNHSNINTNDTTTCNNTKHLHQQLHQQQLCLSSQQQQQQHQRPQRTSCDPRPEEVRCSLTKTSQ